MGDQATGAGPQPAKVSARADARSWTGAEAISAALSSSVQRLEAHLPGAKVGIDPEDVHQARVATRRLRSDLRTFGPLLDPDWAASLRSELAWLGDALGEARDADVIEGVVRAALASAPEVSVASGPLLEALARRRGRAQQRLVRCLDDDRTSEILGRLTDAVCAPHTLPDAERRATKVLPRCVARTWTKLQRAVAELPGEPTLGDLHRIRILAKRARYATEAVAPAVGGKRGRRFARAAASLQDELGERNDGAMAAGWLAEIAPTLTPREAFAAGSLAERLAATSTTGDARWRRSYRRMRTHSRWLT